jgi:hypothetical protein
LTVQDGLVIVSINENGHYYTTKILFNNLDY